MRLTEVRFTITQCDCCGTALPLLWSTVLIEPVVPRFIGGKVDLTEMWVNEMKVPNLPPVIFSATDPQEVVDMDELSEADVDCVLEENFLPGDCWQDVAEQLGYLVPDRASTDHPLACDFCGEAQEFGKPALLVQHCLLEKALRTPVDGLSGRVRGSLVRSEEYSDMLMCLGCAYLISKKVVGPRTINGQHVERPVWPML